MTDDRSWLDTPDQHIYPAPPRVAEKPLARRGTAYEDGWRTLQLFIARENHPNVPKGHIEDGVELGSWVAQRRKEFREGKLTQPEIDRLQEINNWSWDPRIGHFIDGIRALRHYVAREGHARVSERHQEGDFNLGRWVISRRVEHRQGILSEPRVRMLEAIPGWIWEPYEDNWNAAWEALEVFVAREGHARVPAEHIEGFVNLGSWVRWRRRDYKVGAMNMETMARLSALPGWVWENRGGHADS